jgi:hypothetical protein
MKFKDIIVPIAAALIALLTSLIVTKLTINNQNNILEREYQIKIFEKRMSIIDDASKLVGANSGLNDTLNKFQSDYKKNKYDHELIKTLMNYNEKWQTTVNLSSLYFGSKTLNAIEKLDQESEIWWYKSESLQHQYIVAMMNEVMLENITTPSDVLQDDDNHHDRSKTNNPLILTVILIIFVFIITLIKKLTPIIVCMFGLWLLAGILLFYISDNSFISDWINSAVAIGTIGAVITTLYLTKKSSKDANIRELKDDVKLMIKNLEEFFMRIVKSSNEYNEAKKRTANLENEIIPITEEFRFFSRDQSLSKENIAKEHLNFVINECSLWLGIQQFDNDEINQKIKELTAQLTNDISKLEMNYLEIIQSFVKSVRVILQNL